MLQDNGIGTSGQYGCGGLDFHINAALLGISPLRHVRFGGYRLFYAPYLLLIIKFILIYTFLCDILAPVR